MTQQRATIEIREAATSRPSAVNREAGIIENVKLVGLAAPRKNRRYLPQALKEAVTLYEGAKVNVDHVDDPSKGRGLGDRIGRLEGVYFKENDGLYAERFRYNPEHPLAKSLAWWAENDPNGLGFSHHVLGVSTWSGGEQVIESIQSVKSVDLVADPATTKGLFESENEPGGEEMTDLAKLTFDELKKARPDLVEAMESDRAEAGKVAGLEKNVAELTESLQVYQAKEAKIERAAKARKACEDAKLAKDAVTEVFLESLVSAEDSRWSDLIKDRAAVYRPASGGQGPQSVETAEGLAESDLVEDVKKLETIWR
jgi:hypothetical protein